MIDGAHIVIFSRDAEADRAFLRDVIGFSALDAGHGAGNSTSCATTWMPRSPDCGRPASPADRSAPRAGAG